MNPTPIHGLELQEYLFSQTLGQYAGRKTVNKSAEQIRQTFRLHRFAVISWLMQNGVEIPANLLADEAHPPVGQQYPDQPTKPASS